MQAAGAGGEQWAEREDPSPLPTSEQSPPAREIIHTQGAVWEVELGFSALWGAVVSLMGGEFAETPVLEG